MKRGLSCSALVLLALGAHGADRGDQSLASLDAQARAQAGDFGARASSLSQRIARGWPQEAVRTLLGEPERIQRMVDGHDQIEVWGYQGFDVRIQFRNGLVDNWFVRFAQ